MTEGLGSRVPARGYTWPPFESGNLAALQHGVYSPRKVDPLVIEILALVEPTVTWWQPADRLTALAWARAEAQCQLLTEYLMAAAELAGDGVGDLDADRVKSAYLLLHRAESRAESLRSKLGLDPLSRARLGRDVAAGSVDVAKLMAALAERVATDGEDDD